MRIGSFSVLIPEGREYGSGHVGLRHGQVYTIRLGNHSHLCGDAQLFIDGKDMGTYRLDGYKTWTLECAHTDPGRFTFFRADSADGAAVGGSVASTDRGLVVVRFKPEVNHQRPQHFDFTDVAVIPDVGKRTVPPVPRWGGFESLGTGPSVEATYGTPRCCTEEKTCGGILPPIGAAAGVTGLTGHSGQRFYQVPELSYDPNGEVVISLRLVEDVTVPLTARPLVPARANPVPAPLP